MTSSAKWFLLVLVAFLGARQAFSSKRARFSLLPVLALLLGVLSLFAAAPAQAQNTLTGLSLSDGTNAIAFSPTFTASTRDYTATVGSGVTSVIVTPTWTTGSSVMVSSFNEDRTVILTSLTSIGSSGSSATLSVGTSNAVVLVSIGTTPYRITINRENTGTPQPPTGGEPSDPRLRP